MCARRTTMTSKRGSPNRYCDCSSRTELLVVESDHCDNGKPNEKRQHDELRDQAWRLGLCRRQRLQERQLLERLDDSDEDIEIESHPSADDVDPAPGSRQPVAIKRQDRDRQ